MEKGAQLHVDHQVETFLSLPLNLLDDLIKKINQEEVEEIAAVKKRYSEHKKHLQSLLGVEYV